MKEYEPGTLECRIIFVATRGADVSMGIGLVDVVGGDAEREGGGRDGVVGEEIKMSKPW